MWTFMLDRCDFTPLLTAVGAGVGYLVVLARHGPLTPLSAVIKDEILREIAFWGFVGGIAGAVLDYA
jgi:hypothetical protein